jgi:hypothetical protein
MSYRPICDTWILARPKVKYYGAYPSGFLSRARALLGVGASGVVLHVCAGRIRDYPFKGLGLHDMTVDLDPRTKPDFIMDVGRKLPERPASDGLWDGIMIDRPYTPDDAAKYLPGVAALPPLNALLKRSLRAVPVGSRVGVLDYLWPHPGAYGREVAVVGVGTGRNARARWYTVFERIP